jgi:hypothetical protein
MATAQANALLLAVCDQAGPSENRDDDTPPPGGGPAMGTARWTGSAGCYLSRRRATARTSPAVERYVEETLIVDRSDPTGVQYASGDVLLISSRGVERTVEIDDVIDTDAPPDLEAALAGPGVYTARLVLARAVPTS